MSKTNCRNCGGPLNIADSKCPFCGTKNVNLTDIDLASGEAANFIFRLPHNIVGKNGGEVYISILAIPELEAIEITTNSIEVSGGWGMKPLITYDTGADLQMSLNLHATTINGNSEICSLTTR